MKVQNGEHGSCGGGPRVCWAKYGGLDFLFFVVNSVFILRPLNFIIAMVRNLSAQKKTETELVGRRSSAFADPSIAFWLFKSLHYLLPPIISFIIPQPRPNVKVLRRACVGIVDISYRLAVPSCEVGYYRSFR